MTTVPMAIPKTSDLCDACEDVAMVELPLRSFGRRMSFAGAARTVRYAKGGLSVLRDALREDGAGQVMVIDGAEVGWRALFGDRMAAVAEFARWEGVVINGLIRDSAEINAMHIGVKALGTAPRRASLESAGERDVDVCFGGATIKPGQRIVADEDGVVVLPLGLLEHDIDIESAAAATGRYAAGQQ